MDYDIFTHQMTGRWIAQSSNYFSFYNQDSFSCTFTNQVEWTYLFDHDKYIDIIKKNIQAPNIQNYLSLYRIKLISKEYSNRIYYAVLLKSKANQTCLLKFNEELTLINNFFIQDYSKNNFCLVSHVKDLRIIEKIYFLNDNVKVIKSIIRKNNKYIATSFSSEIKIS